MTSLSVVLVRPKYPRNIGLVSRVLCNYGVERLVLVTPQCELDIEAKQGAAQGQKPLDNVVIYSSWEEFYKHEPDGLRVAFSRRQGRRRPSLPLDELLQEPVFQGDRPIYFFFGAEDHGLSAEDLEMVHRMAHFDLPGDLQSMNLSHSVLVAVHSFYQSFGKPQKPETPTSEVAIDPEPYLKDWLEKLNFDLESQSKWNALVMLKQLIMRASPTNEEIHKLEMIIRQTIRRLS